MRISQPVADLLNDQIHHELDASYIYLGMAAYFDNQGLGGFGSWFRAHSEEERAHAMKLYDFLAASNVPVSLKALAAPTVDYDSPAAVIRSALEHEEKVTEQIKVIFAAAMEGKDFTAQPLLNWFLAEQVEEEDLFNTTLDRVEAVATRFDLMTLDRELGARQPSTAQADATE